MALAALLGLLLLAPTLSATALQYQDVTQAAGIAFQTAGEIHGDDVHDVEWPAFPEILGGGACWADFDGDGWQDLYIVNHRFNRENPHVGDWADGLDPRDVLYLNNGDGTFRDATDRAGIPGREFGYSCAVGDADGDSDLDLFVGNFGRDRFWINDGNARFTDHTDASGIGADALCLGKPCVTQSAAWADYDKDGDLDLYVTNYVETNYTDGARGPAQHIGQHNRLYNNDGTGAFTEVAQQVGVAGNPTNMEGSKSFTAVWEDFDGDDDLDIYVTNDMVPNDYYENLGDGTFVERSNETGLADARAGMGLTTGDFDGDCRPDLFFTHYDRQDNGLYRNLGDGTFEDLSGWGEHHQSSWHKIGWGTHFFDVDLDGDEDILAVNGHTDWLTGESVNWTSYPQQMELFRNDPVPGTVPDWKAIHNESGPSFAVKWVARGASLADHDLDGDIDFFVVPNANQTATLHRASEVAGNWLRVELRGDDGNTMGVGARVDVRVDGVTQCKRVLAGSGFLGQNDLALTFGLGDATAVEAIDIRWPSGKVSHFDALGANQVLRFFEATDTFVADTLAPRTTLVTDVVGQPDWWRTPVTVRFDTTDLGVTETSGVVQREYRIDDGPWQPYDGASFPFDEPGATVFTVRAHDAAGNREPDRVFHIGRDFEPPVGTHHVDGTPGSAPWWTSPTVSVILGGIDDLSGIGDIRYRIDGGPWTRYETPLEFGGDGGVYRIEYVVADRAGNLGAARVLSLRHDPVAPQIDLRTPAASGLYVQGQLVPVALPTPDAILVGAPNPFAPAQDEIVAYVVTTDNVSGVYYQDLARDGAVVAWSTNQNINWRWHLDQEPTGTHVLNVSAIDRAGNAAHLDRVVHVVSQEPPSGLEPEGPSVGLGLVPLAALVGIAGIVRRRH